MPDVEADPLDAPRPPRWRPIAAAVVLAVVVVAAIFAIYRDRHSFADTIRHIGVAATIAAFLAGLLGVAATYPAWRQVLAGLGVQFGWGAGARVFFVSQLGKYLPGSVWPVLLQMEAGRARGASRRTMLAANLITVVLSCATGLLLACLLLPITDAHALAHYWWLLLALPPLVGLLHPRAMTALLDRLFRLVGRAPLGERLPLTATASAAGWSTLSWLALGLQLWILYAAAGPVSLQRLVAVHRSHGAGRVRRHPVHPGAGRGRTARAGSRPGAQARSGGGWCTGDRGRIAGTARGRGSVARGRCLRGASLGRPPSARSGPVPAQDGVG